MNADGARLWNVVDPGQRAGIDLGTVAPFAVSPTGDEIVYATCDYAGHLVESEREDHQFELARINLDGSNHSRLTLNAFFDYQPSWSPDGTRIALLRSVSPGVIGLPSPVSLGGFPIWPDVRLHTMAPDGSRVQALGPPSLANHAPQWSPDSGVLAAVGYDEDRPGRWLYTVNVDGSDWRRLSETVSGPSWSPDGERLAFAKPDGDDVGLFTIARDGTDARRATTITGWQPRDREPNPTHAWIETVAWSPDGSKIMYSCGGICVVDLDDPPVREAPSPVEKPVSSAEDDVHSEPRGKPRVYEVMVAPRGAAAWSPDGSRIAIASTTGVGRDQNVGRDSIVRTMAPDGSNVRVLVLVHAEDGLQAMGPRPPAGPVDVAGCAAGTAVPRPEANPGLVQDCETLLIVQAQLVGVGGLGWTTDRPLKDWDGVLLGDPRLGVYQPPLHVRRLMLRGRGLRGEIPPELTQLTQLAWLDLSGNHLEGEIPPALGALTDLEVLNLSGNYLSGCIPPTLYQVPDHDLARLELPDCEPA